MVLLAIMVMVMVMVVIVATLIVRRTLRWARRNDSGSGSGPASP